MQSSTLWGVLGLCLLSVGAWGQEEYKVSISGTDVILTCPQKILQGTINWERNEKKKNDEQLLLKNFSEMDDSGYYACYTPSEQKDKSTRNYLYLRARVCENCVEVDLTAVATVIVVDIIVTLGLLMLVYYWSKNRKAKSKPVTRGAGAGGRPRGQKKERPPPVPNPDYEPIRKGQRDLYSGLNQRGI
uniref:T-cell surface glycoprotein CD3 epsilon chain n=1 Tax=Urocitellus parryii TaxID=9999 RepID=A0A8D2KEL4_UROPR